MLRFFRRVSKSKIGTWIVAIVVLGIMGGFAAGDISNFGSGNIGFGGMSSSVLAKVGDQEVSERDMGDEMQRQLQRVRQEKPDADYSSIAGDFDPILADLIDQRSLIAFADKYGFRLSKALIDAEITQIPGTKGLNGKFSDQQYQAFLAQQHLTDAKVREIVTTGLLQKLVLTPIATNSRVPLGMAAPYASMMLEAREGDAAVIPLDPFKAGLKPTDAQLQQFYSANRNRYMIPEQRVLRIAMIGPEQVANVAASDKEIADYYNAHQADYAAKETRSLSQAVVPDQNAANGIAARAKGGASIADAAKPAGANAAVTSLTDQSRDAYAGVAGAKVAATVFSAASGAVVGPVQSDFGWVVVKVDSVKSTGGKSLAQAHDEIAAKLNTEKRKGAVEDLDAKVEDAISNGSNFAEAVAAGKLPVTTTPLITAAGTSRADAKFALAPELAPALKSGFDMQPNDPPDVVPLPNDKGYAVVSPAQVVPAAPAPLASIHDQVAADWINDQAFQRARAAATAIAAKANGGTTLDEAMKEAGVALPPVRPLAARRIQLAQAGAQIPVPLKQLFTLAQGKSQARADPQGRGFYIVKVNKIIPGNATLQPTLIAQMRNELQQSVSADYARQFLAAIREHMKVKRNESAIAAEKTRISTSGS
jgi:peptidyl-prolyl cis-trans isomerase D